MSGLMFNTLMVFLKEFFQKSALIYKSIQICEDVHHSGLIHKCNKLYQAYLHKILKRERSGSVVECLTRARTAAGSNLTSLTALWSLSKAHLS